MKFVIGVRYCIKLRYFLFVFIVVFIFLIVYRSKEFFREDYLEVYLVYSERRYIFIIKVEIEV